MPKNPAAKTLAMLLPLVFAIGLCSCAPVQPGAPYALAPSLPYAACGDMTVLRANLTGEAAPSLASDAALRTAGVRCIGEGVRAPY